jgi:hypothetical protein
MNELLQPLAIIARRMTKLSYDFRNEVPGQPAPGEPPRPSLGDVEKIFSSISSFPENFSASELINKFYEIAQAGEAEARLLIDTGYQRFVDIGMEFMELASTLGRRAAQAELALIRDELRTVMSDLPSTKLELQGATEALASVRSALQDAKAELYELMTEQRDQHLKVRGDIQKTELDVARLDESVLVAGRDLKNDLDVLQERQNAQAEVLKIRNDEIDALFADVAAKSVALDYHRSAAAEEGVANRTRFAALAFMTVMLIVLVISVYQTLNADLTWQAALSRIMFILAFSIPAAYLARESAKHRAQQYLYHQTALGTTALPGFIRTLSPEKQEEIKAAIASKVFSPREAMKGCADPSPVNVHELLIELIKKLEMPDKTAK